MGRAYQNKKDSMAKTAGAKTKVYSKYGKEIYICAKNGGLDHDGNLSLRSATRYEGYGPGNCMIIVDCLTDNNKRTFADVRVCFTKANAKIGAQNSVSHLFDHLAIFVFDGDDDEAVLEALMMADVDVTDVEVEAGKVTVFAPHTEYNNTRTALEEMGITEFDEDLISFVPQIAAPIAGEDVEVMERFLAMLEDCDDVQNVYHNAQF